MYGTHHRTTIRLTRLADARIQNVEQRVLLLVVFHRLFLVRLGLRGTVGCHLVNQTGKVFAFCCSLFVGFGNGFRISFLLLCGFGCVLRSLVHTGILVVDLRQLGKNLAQFIRLPELQIGTSLKQFAHALWFLDARQLNQDATRLCQTLDIGLNHAETVNTGAQHVKRVVNGTVHLLAQHVLHLFVGGGGRHFLLQFECGENACQLGIGIHLVERLKEQRQEVRVARALFLQRHVHRTGECFRCVVTAQRAENVRHRHLHNNVHTAL